MYTYHDFKMFYTTADMVFCETKDLSTAYKVIISHSGNVNSNFIKQAVDDLDGLEREYKCHFQNVKIIGDSLDRRALLFLRIFREKGMFGDFEFEFADKKYPAPGLKLYFYVNGKIINVGVEDSEYENGDYFSADELKEDMLAMFTDIPDSQLVPFYVRNWVPFTKIPDFVEEAYDRYLDDISNASGEESYGYTIKVKPNGTRAYY